MSEFELYQELAEKTGDTRTTLHRLGFSLLQPNMIEERDEPLMIDWDEIDSSRVGGL